MLSLFLLKLCFFLCLEIYFLFVFNAQWKRAILSYAFWSFSWFRCYLGFDVLTDKVLIPTTVAGDNDISVAGQQQNAASTGKVLTGDLDSSLASLAQNLTINKSAQQQVK